MVIIWYMAIIWNIVYFYHFQHSYVEKKKKTISELINKPYLLIMQLPIKFFKENFLCSAVIIMLLVSFHTTGKQIFIVKFEM